MTGPGDPRRHDVRRALGLRPIINVSGTMTALGASIMVPEAVAAMAAIAGEFVEIEDLQRRAGAVVSRLTGAEAGFVTASCAAGMAMSVAGAMTRDDLLAVERLPDTTGLRNEVLILQGHCVSYGAPVEQSIRLAGARPVLVGTLTLALAYHLENAITQNTAAALFVVSHHTVQTGMIPLAEFCAICHARNVPVIVDAASEYDLRGFLAAGADLVIYSGHKFLGGPTSGIVAGRKDLVRAAWLQNRGIGRGMKVGKESVAGVMAALEAWERRDHAAVRQRELQALDLWLAALAPLASVAARIVPDFTGNPLDRIELTVREEAGFSAAALAAALAAGDPPVMVRDDEADLGHVHLDPCNLHPGEAEIVARRLVETIRSAEADGLPEPDRNAGVRRLLRWPD